jgi:hypothetical protein
MNNRVKYAVRVTLFSASNGLIIEHRNRHTTYEHLHALLNKLPAHSYKMLPTSSLINVPLPVQGDLLTSSSELLRG